MEQWKDIEGFIGKYQISSLGRCRHLPDNFILKPQFRKNNKCSHYSQVSYNLHRGTTNFQIRACKEVAKAFLGEQPANSIIDHIDRDTTNNNMNNLRYISTSQNLINRTCYGAIVYRNKKYYSEYYVNKKRYYKHFETKEQAEEYHIEMFPFYEALRLEICSEF